jgi:integrase
MKGCRPLNRHERKAILAQIHDPREQALFNLGIATGFRISELLSLRIGDGVDPRDQALHYITVQASKTKTKEDRTVPLNANARRAVEAQARHLLKQGYSREASLFLSRKGPGLKSITRVQAWRILKKLFTLADVLGNVATHTLRKTFAREVYRAVGKIELVQIALGHQSITSTMSYLSFNHDEVTQAIIGIEI